MFPVEDTAPGGFVWGCSHIGLSHMPSFQISPHILPIAICYTTLYREGRYGSVTYYGNIIDTLNIRLDCPVVQRRWQP